MSATPTMGLVGNIVTYGKKSFDGNQSSLIRILPWVLEVLEVARDGQNC